MTGSEDGAPGANGPEEATNLPTLPLKSKLPVLCGTILICETLVVYLALLMGYGLRPVPLVWLIVGAVVLAVLCIVAAATLPRKALTNRPGIVLGWVVQVLILVSALVMPAMAVIAVVFGTMWAFAVYWGRRIDREATAWAKETIARAHGGTNVS